MIGNEENQEEVVLKVIDRRKFNSDGSVKDGVQLDPEPAPKPVEPKPEAAPPETRVFNEVSDPTEPTSNAEEPSLEPLSEDDEMPGADDPASFVNFLSTLATNAAAALGAVPHPATGKRALDLDTGKYWLDILAMVKDKTKGNLHPQESQLLDGLLSDLRMQYVTMVRATEEKLKAQAAQKFGAADILGKK
jgi:Domain of unknown function (DUF1844).